MVQNYKDNKTGNLKDEITAILLYEFKDAKLLQTALTHPSKEKNITYQRLEFLGDRILSFHVAHKIFSLYENDSEGKLAVLFSHLVSADAIAKIVSPHILMHIQYTGQVNNSIIADTFESVLAAIFLDGGDVKNIIDTLWAPYINNHKNHDFKSPKNILQEITRHDCEYKLQKHVHSNDLEKRKFTVKVTTKGNDALGEGKSKKEASENAAYNLINKLKKLDED
jgi:ribonuclease-3